MSVSTADCEISSSSAISWYDRPCHSRSRIAWRWLSGMCSSASVRRIRSSGDSCEGAGTTSCTAAKSLGDSMRPRRHVERRRVRQTLCAILNSHASSASGVTPRCSARCAFRNVDWSASSASSREPSLLTQNPKTCPE
jgi:hypothetical protein